MFVFILTLNGLYSQGVAICATIAAPIHFGDAFHNLDVVIVSCSWKVKNQRCIKNATGTLWHISKMVAPRVKAQANGQNNRSRALKRGIVHLCSSNTFGDTIEFMRLWVFQFLHSYKKWQNYCTKS